MSLFKKLMGYPADDASKPHNYHQKKEVNMQRDLIEFVKITSSDQAVGLADQLLDRVPLVVNFEDLGVSESNQMIAFLSGVVYSMDGTNLQLRSKVFLFTADENLKDGTIMEFFHEYKEE
jgi:cell division inhibitor SepF